MALLSYVIIFCKFHYNNCTLRLPPLLREDTPMNIGEKGFNQRGFNRK